MVLSKDLMKLWIFNKEVYCIFQHKVILRTRLIIFLVVYLFNNHEDNKIREENMEIKETKENCLLNIINQLNLIIKVYKLNLKLIILVVGLLIHIVKQRGLIVISIILLFFDYLIIDFCFYDMNRRRIEKNEQVDGKRFYLKVKPKKILMLKSIKKLL